jgi:hypothetical protein
MAEQAESALASQHHEALHPAKQERELAWIAASQQGEVAAFNHLVLTVCR